MTKFVVKTLIALTLAGALHLYAAYRMGGHTDAAYLRFTVPPQESLIVGSSRAAQGIRPAVLNRGEGPDLYNFSFNLLESPFGEIYHGKIERMIEPTPGALFIVEVNPWTTAKFSEAPDDDFTEEGGSLGRVDTLHRRPNFEYLTKQLQQPWGRALLPPTPGVEIMADGWARVTVELTPEARARQTKLRRAGYSVRARYVEASPPRILWLEETVDLLAEHGDVVLVRLPVPDWMLDLELQADSAFSDRIEGLAEARDLPYLDYSDRGDEYEFTDGNHLLPDSPFSEHLLEDLRRLGLR